MSKVLYIQASARGERSASINVSDAFLKAYKESHPDDEITTYNLWEADIPEFDRAASNGKYAVLSGADIPDADKEAWAKVLSTIEYFKSFDKYVFSVPMWNFGIPYKLKQFLDVIIQPGQTFKFEDGQYTGLVTGKPAFIAFARGGEYAGDASAWDFQKPYFELALGFIGFSNVQSLTIEPTMMGGPDVARAKIDEVIGNAKEIAVQF